MLHWSHEAQPPAGLIGFLVSPYLIEVTLEGKP
jgi:hypothetical protein